MFHTSLLISILYGINCISSQYKYSEIVYGLDVKPIFVFNICSRFIIQIDLNKPQPINFAKSNKLQQAGNVSWVECICPTPARWCAKRCLFVWYPVWTHEMVLFVFPLHFFICLQMLLPIYQRGDVEQEQPNYLIFLKLTNKINGQDIQRIVTIV